MCMLVTSTTQQSMTALHIVLRCPRGPPSWPAICFPHMLHLPALGNEDCPRRCDIPPQCRYATRRPLTFPPPEPLVRRIPPKRARTLGPGESSRHAHLNPQAPANSQRPSGIASKAIIKRPMVTIPPIKGNSNYRARPFHSELYFDIEDMRQQSELQDSFELLQRYHL